MESKMHQWLIQTHKTVRDGQNGYETESSEALRKALINLGASVAIGFGGLALAQDLPYPQKPIVNLSALCPAMFLAFKAFRPLDHRRRAESAWLGLATAEVNGVEHATRTLFERPPSEVFDTLSLTLPVDANIPTEDLAYTLATATNSGTLIVAPSGSGKTMFIRRAQYNAHQHYKGLVDFYGIDCKGDEDGWLGLEHNPQRFVVMNSAQVPQGFSMLEHLVEKLNSLTPETPTIALLDEWNNGISSAVKYDQAQPSGQRQNYASRMILNGCEIVTKGRSKKVFGWMTTHSPKAEKIGMDPSTRESVNTVILARGNKLGLITSILKGKFDFVDDEEVRDALLAQWMAFRQVNPNPEQPIALTNLGGQWRLVQLPDYRQPLPNIFNSLPSSASPSTLPPYDLDADFTLDDEWSDEDDDLDQDDGHVSTLPLPRYLAQSPTITERERQAVIKLYHHQGVVNKGMIARQVWDVTPGGGRSWTDGAKPKIDRILQEHETSVKQQLERSFRSSHPDVDPFEFTASNADEIVYQNYREHRFNGGDVGTFVEQTWGVKKPSQDFYVARSKLFNVIRLRLKEWVEECFARDVKPSKPQMVLEIWGVEDKPVGDNCAWKDADRMMRFTELKRLLNEAIEAIEQQ